MLFKTQKLEFSWKNSRLFCITEPQDHRIVETSPGEGNKRQGVTQGREAGSTTHFSPNGFLQDFSAADVRLGRNVHLSPLKSHSNILAAIQNQFREMWTYHSTTNVGEYYTNSGERNGRDVESREVEIIPGLEVTVGITSSTTDKSAKC